MQKWHPYEKKYGQSKCGEIRTWLVEENDRFVCWVRRKELSFMDKCRQQNCRNHRNMTRGCNHPRMNCGYEQPMYQGCNSGCGGYMNHMMYKDDCPDVLGDPLSGMPLGMGYVPWQKFNNLYEECEAMYHGTIFHDLDLDFCGKRC